MYLLSPSLNDCDDQHLRQDFYLRKMRPASPQDAAEGGDERCKYRAQPFAASASLTARGGLFCRRVSPLHVELFTRRLVFDIGGEDVKAA